MCVCACKMGGDLAAITKFISIHVFRSWLMGALPSERCADRMWTLMGNSLRVVFWGGAAIQK